MHMAQILLLGLLAAMLAIAAFTDIRARIIPNGLNLAIALLAGVWWWANGLGIADISIQIGLAFGALILFGACFAAGMMGGGDVKLIAALALWLPGGALLQMLVWMALAGGVLTVAMLAIHAIRRAPGRPEIPYGVAIVIATIPFVANDILTTQLS